IRVVESLDAALTPHCPQRPIGRKCEVTEFGLRWRSLGARPTHPAQPMLVAHPHCPIGSLMQKRITSRDSVPEGTHLKLRLAPAPEQQWPTPRLHPHRSRVVHEEPRRKSARIAFVRADLLADRAAQPEQPGRILHPERAIEIPHQAAHLARRRAPTV